MENFPSKKVESKEDFEKRHYKYVRKEKVTRETYKGPIEVEEFERFCLDPEGRQITLQSGDNQCGISSESYFWRYDPDNYNNDNMGWNESDETCKNMLEKAGLKEIPKALPLPDEWRKLLPKDLKEKFFFSDESYDEEWVHTHFNELYEAIQRGQLPLLGGDEGGGVYVEPSKDGKKVYFCGRGDLASYYYLDL